MPRTWDRSRFAPWLLRALGQVNEEPTSRLCRRTSELSRAAKRRRLQRRVSVPPTLRIDSFKMKQPRRAAQHVLLFYPCAEGSLPLLALPALHLTGGTYGQKRQADQAHSRQYAHHPSACRWHRCGGGRALGLCPRRSRCPARPEI